MFSLGAATGKLPTSNLTKAPPLVRVIRHLIVPRAALSRPLLPYYSIIWRLLARTLYTHVTPARKCSPELRLKIFEIC